MEIILLNGGCLLVLYVLYKTYVFKGCKVQAMLPITRTAIKPAFTNAEARRFIRIVLA